MKFINKRLKFIYLFLSILTLLFITNYAASTASANSPQSYKFIRWYFDVSVNNDIIVEETVELWMYDATINQDVFLTWYTANLACQTIGPPLMFNSYGDAAFFDGNSYVDCATFDLYDVADMLSSSIEPTLPLHLCKDEEGNPLPPPCQLSAKGLAVESVVQMIPDLWMQYPNYHNNLFSYQHIQYALPIGSYFPDIFYVEAELEVDGQPKTSIMLMETGGINNLAEPHVFGVEQETELAWSFPFVFRADGVFQYEEYGETFYEFSTDPTSFYVGKNLQTADNFIGWFMWGKVDPATICASCGS